MLGGLDDWRRALDAAGVSLTDGGDAANPDHHLVVAPAAQVDEALARGASLAIFEGSPSARKLAVVGLSARRLVALGDAPPCLFSLEQPAAADFAARQWAIRHSIPLVPGLGRSLRTAARVALRPRLTIASHRNEPPSLVAAAGQLGVPNDAESLLTLHDAGPTSRSVLLVFRRGARDPEWALKVTRGSDAAARIERERRGLERAHAAGGAVSAHAPAFLGVVDDGSELASVESAAAGQTLSTFLRTRRSRSAKIRRLSQVGEWVAELAQRTLAPAEELKELRERIASEYADGPRRHLIDTLPSVGAVLQHGDLGLTNVLVDGNDFTVIDWEHARMGFPLLDVCSLARTALPELDQVPLDENARADYLVRAFRGETASSPLLFEWVRAAAAAAHLPPHAVGPLIGLGWEMLGKHLLVERWLADPALGTSWNRWRD